MALSLEDTPAHRTAWARRAPVTSAKRAEAYSRLNHAADYLDAAQDALRAGDDDQARDCIVVLVAIAELAASLLHSGSVH